MGQRKLCRVCGDLVELKGFNRHTISPDGREYVCISCLNKQRAISKASKKRFEGLNLITGWKPPRPY